MKIYLLLATSLNFTLYSIRFSGFKKLMWPIFIAVQVAKTVLLAMFLPSIIGSIGKMVGKGKRFTFEISLKYV